MNRYDPKLENKSVQRAPSLGTDREFEEEHKDVQADDEISHVWRAVAWLVVANRDHGRSRSSSTIIDERRKGLEKPAIISFQFPWAGVLSLVYRSSHRGHTSCARGQA